jgi:hypothetical protein
MRALNIEAKLTSDIDSLLENRNSHHPYEVIVDIIDAISMLFSRPQYSKFIDQITDQKWADLNQKIDTYVAANNLQEFELYPRILKARKGIEDTRIAAILPT